MLKRFATATLIMVAPLAAGGQASKTERQVRAFLAEYDRAVASRNIAFLEQALPNDYVYTGAGGRKSDRARVLKFLKQEHDKPTYRMNSLKHEDVVVRVVGNMAVVTNDYVADATPLDSPGAESHVDTGRHTAVFEKRGGHWVVIAEQDTEQAHDDKVMEQQVLAAGRAYNELTRRLKSGRSYAELEQGGDIAILKRLLTDEYTCTSPDGVLHNKGDALKGYTRNATRLDSAELSEQKVRVIDNNTAVETGRMRYVGIKDGTLFRGAQRFTRTWVFSDRWQIMADHFSVVTKED